MTTKTEFTQEEWEALQKGLTGAGFLMAVSDRSFFDSFKEAGALARHLADARKGDGNQTIELHHVDGLNHSDNMIIAYLPKQKIIVSADMGGPPPAGSPAPANISNNSIVLYNNIKRLKLDVTTHVPIHGAPGPQAEFDRIVGPAAARAPQQQGGGE